MRAFDRRPPPGVEGSARQPHHGDQGPTTSHQNPPPVLAEIASSSSGDDNNPSSSHAIGDESCSLELDNEFMWDLDQLNW